MALRLILAETTDTYRSTLGDLSNQIDRLSTGGVGKQLSLVAIEESFSFGVLVGTELEDLRDEFGFGRERRQPDVEVTICDPSILGDSPRRMSGHPDAQALLACGRGSYSKGGKL